jgi:hypothetical protein
MGYRYKFSDLSRNLQGGLTLQAARSRPAKRGIHAPIALRTQRIVSRAGTANHGNSNTKTPNRRLSTKTRRHRPRSQSRLSRYSLLKLQLLLCHAGPACAQARSSQPFGRTDRGADAAKTISSIQLQSADVRIQEALQ